MKRTKKKIKILQRGKKKTSFNTVTNKVEKNVQSNLREVPVSMLSTPYKMGKTSFL